MENLILDSAIPSVMSRLESGPKAIPLPVPSVVVKDPVTVTVNPVEKVEQTIQSLSLDPPPPSIPPPPIYSGYLHERAQWKFGPRWNRFKCTLYPKLLVVGSHSFKIGKDDYRIALAVEVHSRPFAFKLEQCRANQGNLIINRTTDQL